MSIICLFILISQANAQTEKDTAKKDLIDVARRIFDFEPPDEQQQSNKKVRLSLLPFSTGSDRRISLSAINLAFFRGDPQITNLSTVYFYPYTNFSGRYSFSIISNIWSPGNKYNFTGDFKISSNTYDDYGLGSASPGVAASVLDYNHTRFHFQASRLLIHHFYMGLGYALDSYSDVSQQEADIAVTDFELYPFGTSSSSTSSGLTINILRDNRKNSLNPERGYYTNISWQWFDPVLGSTYAWKAVTADMRKYFPLKTKRWSLFATRLFFWDTWGDVPYLDLPATFTDREARVGRGYYYSRFRGRGLIFGEAEYRITLSANQFWGAVVFVNAQSSREYESGNFEYVNPGAGVGLRLKFNKRSNANLTLDFAFGKNSFNWYLNLGEFF